MINGYDKLKQMYPEFDEESRTPNGIDLQLGKVYEITNKENKICGLIHGEKHNAEHIEIPPTIINGIIDVWELKPHHSYIMEVDRQIQIGENNVQLYFPRSTLLRNNIDLRTAVGDAGYFGKLSFLCINHNDYPFYITKGERFAQLVDFELKDNSILYNGDYQENPDEEWDTSNRIQF